MIRKDRSGLREHLAATTYLLGSEPLREIHIFMDAAAKRYRGPGHRLLNHSLDTADLLSRYYRKHAPDMATQAYREVVLHIAYDRGLIQGEDVVLMREYTKALRPRTRAASIRRTRAPSG